MKKLITIVLLLIFGVAKGQDLLENYQKEALENNPALQAQYKAFEAAMERTSQVNALPDPTLSIGYFISPVETRVGPQRARLSLTQMFPWFGSLKAQGDVAALEAQAKYEVFVDAQNKIKFEVARAYYSLQQVAELQKVVKANIAFVTTIKDLARVQYENGTTSLSDVLRIDLLLSQLNTEKTLLIEKENPLASAFNTLLNREQTQKVEVDSLVIAVAEVAVQDDWQNHPLLKELELKTQATDMRTTAIAKSALPKFGLGLDYVFVDERSDMVIDDNGKDVIMPMVSFTLPIFQKKYKAAKREQSLMKESYEMQTQATVNNLTTQYDQIAYAIEKAQTELELYTQLEEQTQQINRLMLSAYSNAGTNLEGLLQVQLQLLQYQKMSIQSAVELNTQLANATYIMAK